MSGRCRRCSGASPSPSADTVPSTGYDLPTMRTAARPFLFVGCVELRQTLDTHARDARELMHRLAEVPADSEMMRGRLAGARQAAAEVAERLRPHTNMMPMVESLITMQTAVL